MAMGWEDFLSIFISSELSGIWMTQAQAGEPVALVGEPIPVGPFGAILLCPGQAACTHPSKDVLPGHALALPCQP